MAVLQALGLGYGGAGTGVVLRFWQRCNTVAGMPSMPLMQIHWLPLQVMHALACEGVDSVYVHMLAHHPVVCVLTTGKAFECVGYTARKP